MNKVTESDSNHKDLHLKSIDELLVSINLEDQSVAFAVQKVIPAISALVVKCVALNKEGGRLVYIGAGTSGRLGVVDASECPPTFGVPEDLVIGLIAGGDTAIRKSIEFAEDNRALAWKDLQNIHVGPQDMVVGIAASGTTPYVVGGLAECQKNGITTGCITCNLNSPLAAVADFPVECVVGPEFVTGSTRMKAGTAQKMILNMITTTVMIQLGRVVGNRMVDMQLTNNKLMDRGVRMIQEHYEIGEKLARKILQQKGSVRAALNYLEKS